MAVSKVVFGGQTLIDLTQDTVKDNKLLRGTTAHDASGTPITGTCDFDVDSSEANAQDEEVLITKTFARGGEMRTGSMPNNGGVAGTISAKGAKYTIPRGYHDGSGTVGIDPVEEAKLIPENIPDGMTILGVAGTRTGLEGVKAQVKDVTPTKDGFSVLPDTDAGYNYLTQVTVLPIPYVESDNSAGGKTVTIG
jgi:hypothetical protein